MPEAQRPGGVRIHYEVSGPATAGASGAPLVLAHGFSASLGMWSWQQPYLAAGRRLILWDARGHGSSSAPPDPAQYAMPELAADLRAVLEAAGAADSCVVGGMSFGGQIALQYAMDYPAATRALVLSDTTTRGSRAAVEMTQLPAQFAHSPGLAGAYVGMQSRADLTPHLPALTMPALVLYGDWDELIADGVHRLADGLPERRMVRMSGCFHGTSAQRPKDWTDAVLRFLADLDAGVPVSGELTL